MTMPIRRRLTHWLDRYRALSLRERGLIAATVLAATWGLWAVTLGDYLTAAEQLVHAERESAATIGFTSAIAAYGAFLIPKSFGTSISLTGGAEAALLGFLGFYVTCVAVTWFFYTRKNAPVRC